VQNIGNQVVQNAVPNLSVQNVGNQNGLIVIPGIANQNPNRNGNVVATRAEGNVIGNNGNQIRPFKIIERISPVAYKLELPDKLHGIHSTFHVSNLKKCLADENLVIPLEEIQLDDKLHFIKEPVEIIDREVKQLKQSQIPIVKV
ncbi:hypothetical protein Tco_1560013, partial [Tanacetum coccineum]